MLVSELADDSSFRDIIDCFEGRLKSYSQLIVACSRPLSGSAGRRESFKIIVYFCALGGVSTDGWCIAFQRASEQAFHMYDY